MCNLSGSITRKMAILVPGQIYICKVFMTLAPMANLINIGAMYGNSKEQCTKAFMLSTAYCDSLFRYDPKLQT